ncbi:hypothetical protein [Leucobacter sp. wl10]|uniref:hypothetical protein n=1 Tax=Leucobacter sp. wl10 TaxID=2304677 RepID=UPI0013C2C35F|nr:hypothetical protein [Leucobacter sp. wl10]
MSATMTDKTWIDLFIVELRMRRVPGPVIGDAVASVRELLADSGQSAEEAFGPAREYAASLDLPTMQAGQRALKTLFLPVMGLFAFLVFALAGTAWFVGKPVLLSVPQALLLSVPVLLTVLFAFPFYPRAVFRQRWLPVPLVLSAGAASAIAALIAPSTEAEAWLALSPLPLLMVTMTALVVLSVIGTITTLRSNDGDEIIEPLEAQEPSRRRPGRKAFVLFVDWLFPLLAVIIFLMTWGFSLMRP